ncbi:glycosyltransferase family 2 protein [Neobacillus drentensis]|uniref:glycosyltransferase family 2 protein n=1 Tax=Neobacillus drentensis TaxID=220684 RepID=UPI002FFDC37A
MYELVSILTPSFNTGKFIAETIKSVLNQTYQNWEMLIVDDCSTDNSIEVIKSFNDNRIKLFINKNNSGAAISRNYALKEAKGKWIAFLDSDDIWDYKKLEKQITFMKTNNYHFTYTNYIEINENSESIGKLITGPKILNKRSINNFCYPGCLTVMYNSEQIGLIQIENLPKNNDYAIWLKAIKKADCYLLPETLASYRKRSGSISNHSYMKLIKHHYYLWRYGEHKNRVSAILFTIRNLVFGTSKKIKYIKDYK